ncbi:methyltransferase domain-containing protein [Staphylococcus schleiferi subsp. coagulans]|uniref:class I SAM-dependent methyltransferase n=1 Tax=Staphylococcus coagulans TaxID=74706 RepID=UPI0015FBE79A|nr:class I SAM-dependent methyltransferase [Staphylococcus coagulans]MBA8778846.1 methyltransferase domain-containing protein [Staphylococcus coagulans]
MKDNYDVWWQKGNETDDDMARDHEVAWYRTISQIDQADIKDKKVLDFGCNQGGLLRLLYDTIPFQQGVGIDLAKVSLEKAKEMAGNRPLQFYLTDTPTDVKQRFHTVLSTSVLYLIEDVYAHAEAIKAVLEPNGVYYATFSDVTNNPSREYMAETINKYGATPSQDHTLKYVVDSFVQAGFNVAVMKEKVPEEIDITHYADFYLTPNDYLRNIYEESFLIKATLKAGA